LTGCVHYAEQADPFTPTPVASRRACLANRPVPPPCLRAAQLEEALLMASGLVSPDDEAALAAFEKQVDEVRKEGGIEVEDEEEDDEESGDDE